MVKLIIELIKKAEAQNWVENLIIAARKKNPGNQHLKDVAKSLGITSVGEKFWKSCLNSQKIP